MLIPPEAINLLVGVNVPDDYLMAGFEVIMNGRFWASAEGQRLSTLPDLWKRIDDGSEVESEVEGTTMIGSEVDEDERW